jgi:hypothetical protein
MHDKKWKSVNRGLQLFAGPSFAIQRDQNEREPASLPGGCCSSALCPPVVITAVEFDPFHRILLLPLIDPHRYSAPQIATSKEAIMSKLVWASALLCLATMSVPTVAQQSCEKKCMQRCSESATGGGTAQSDCMSKCMNQQGKCPD